MERTGKKDFRANLSQGGAGRNVLNELTEKEKEFCVKAAQACGLEFAGVDFVRDKEGNALFIEANGNPGEKIISVTGHNHYEDLLDLIESKLGNSPNPSSPTPPVVEKASASIIQPATAIGSLDFTGFDYPERAKEHIISAQLKINAGERLTVNEALFYGIYEKDQKKRAMTYSI